MSDKRKLILVNDEVRLRAMEAVRDAPEGHSVVIAPPTRNLEQSAKFHAICGDLAKQHPYAGKQRTLDQWKFLLISGHSVATKQETEIVPGLEGEFLNLRESSAKMTVSRMASLIEYAIAYCVQNNIKLSA